MESITTTGGFKSLKKWLNKLRFAPLSCNGILCAYPLNYTHVTCLMCRTRRRALGKYKDPKRMIHYTYASSIRTYWTPRYRQIVNGKKMEYRRRDGKPLQVNQIFTLQIDPRGRFTQLRCCAIMVLDRVMGWFNLWRPEGEGRPLSEICEFLANYPTW